MFGGGVRRMVSSLTTPGEESAVYSPRIKATDRDHRMVGQSEAKSVIRHFQLSNLFPGDVQSARETDAIW
jgi:hypothetical protein